MYSGGVKSRNIPHLTLPTNDFEEMRTMSNLRLISLLRQAVLAPERAARFSPRPPAEHDAYLVHHSSTSISVRLYSKGEVVFSCNFVRAKEY